MAFILDLRIMKTISILLVSIFLLLSIDINAKGKTSEVTIHETTLQSPWSNAGNRIGKDVVTKRTQFAKHFMNKDGSFTMFSSPASLNYQRSGTWEEINLSILSNHSVESQEHYPYSNEENAFKTYYTSNPLLGGVKTLLKEGSITERIESMYATNEDGDIIYSYSSCNNPEKIIDQNRLLYRNVFPSVDIRYTQQFDGRKFDVILKNKSCVEVLPMDARYIVIKEKVNLPESWIVKETEYGIDIYAAEKWIANFPVPVVYETTAGVMSSSRDADDIMNGSMEFERVGNELTLCTKFPVNWLKEKDRIFPVYLDPVSNYYPANTLMATGRMLAVASSKQSGFLRLGGTGGVAWASFDLSSMPPASVIVDATFWGFHYTGNFPTKSSTIIGLQTINPISSTNTDISSQISSNGPVYNANYTFGGPNYQWRSGTINAAGILDMTSQISQGWTALGFKYTSGSVGTQQQWGYDASTSSNRPYLELTYTSTICSGIPTVGTPLSSVAQTCGLPFVLNLSGFVPEAGLSYQWQSSVPGSNSWNNKGTPLPNPQLTGIAQSSSTEYRCVVTCVNSMQTTHSSTILVPQAPTLFDSSMVTSCNIYTFGGTTYTVSGMYSMPFVTATNCDSIHTLDLTINANTNGLTYNETACNSYSWYGINYTLSGTYTKTLVNSSGCDSVETLNLLIHNSTQFASIIASCNTYSWNGNTYTVSGIYTLSFTTMFGCDSLRILNLTIKQSNTGTSNLTACNSYMFGGNTYTVSGAYIAHFINFQGCDSAHTLNLTINMSSIPATFNASACGSYTWNSITYTVSGIYTRTFINHAGCDSIRTLLLNIANTTVTMNQRAYVPNYASNNVTVVELATNSVLGTVPVGTQPLACAFNPSGSRVYVTNYGANTISVINTYNNTVIATIAGMSGPNRILVHPVLQKVYVSNAIGNTIKVINAQTNIVEASILVSTSPQGICFSPDATKLYVCNYGSSNIHIINLATNSIVNTILSVSTPLNIAISKDGTKLFVPSSSTSEIKVVSTVTNNVIATIPATGAFPTGLVVNKDGTKLYVINSGSSSTIGVINMLTNSIISTLTPGLDYPYGGSLNEDESLLYVTNRGNNTLKAINTVSTTIVSSISVGNDPRSIGKFVGNVPNYITACNSYTWLGSTYTTSGTYTMTLVSAAGCDSIANLDLTINSLNTGSSTLNACNEYIWNGNSYTNSGAYTGTFNNIAGCDSVHTINLQISNQSSSGTSTIDVCNSYVLGGTTYTMTGTYTKTFTNAVGCDSIHILALTIRNSNTGSTNVTQCNSYLWNGTTYTLGGNYIQTFTNSAGCDSIHTLHLTIPYSNTITTVISACNSYLWNGTTYTTSGVYTLSFVNTGGCDSLRILNLTIRKSSLGISIISTCNSYLFQGTTYTTTGVYTGTFTNAAGCDSVHTLNLTIRYKTAGSSRGIACTYYIWNGLPLSLSGAYTLTFLNAAGCDSIHTLNLITQAYATNIIPKAYIPTDNNQVAVLDITTTNITHTIPVGTSPKSVLFSKDGSNVFVSNSGSSSLSVVSTVSNTVTNTISLPSAPGLMAAHPDGKRIYVLGMPDNVYVINTLSNTVETTILLNNGQVANGISMSLDGSKLFVINQSGNKLEVINTSTNTVSLTVPNLFFPSFGPQKIIISPDGSKLIIAGSNNSIQIRSTVDYSLIYTVPAIISPSAICIKSDGSKIYATNQHTVKVINGTTYAIINTIPLPNTLNPKAISINPDGRKVFVCYDSPAYISIISTPNNTVTDSILVNYASDIQGTFIGNIGYNDQTACNSYTWNGTTYTSSGTFTFTGVNMFGCDSTSTLNLIITNSNSVVSSASSCISYTWNGTTYTASGAYTKSFVNVAGCDSLQTLNLTIYQPDSMAYTYTGCNYTWNGITYTESGLYKQAFVNSHGCDSVEYLNLTLNQNTAPKIQKAYIARDKGDVLVINVDNHTIEDSIVTGALPYGISSHPDGSKVYVTNYNSFSVSVISTTTNSVINSIPIGSQPQGIVVSPDGNRVYVANVGAHKVIVIDGIQDTIITRIPVGNQPLGICISPDGSKVYVTNRVSGNVSVINTATNSITATITTGSSPFGIICNATGTRLYVANAGSKTVSVINMFTNAVVATIPIPLNTIPKGITITPDGSKVYVTSTTTTSGLVTIINTLTNTVLSTISIGWFPTGITTNKNGSKIYAISSTHRRFYEIDVATNATTFMSIPGNPDCLGNFIAAVGGASAYGTCTSHSWLGITYTTTGVYTHTEMNTAGCDSLSTLHLSVLPDYSNTGFSNAVACNSFAYNGATYTSSGVYTHTFINSHWCDSIHTLNLTINYSTFSSSFVSVCDSFAWNGTTYIVSGDFSATFQNSVGCDSIHTLHLIIHHPTTTLQRAYIANYGSNTVSVIDLASNTVIDSITVGSGPQGVCVSPDGNRVVVSNTNSNNVSIINTADNSVISTVPIPGPRGIVVSPDNNKLFVLSIATNSVYVIDPLSGSIMAIIPTGSYPAQCCMNSMGTRLYISNYGSNTVSVINTLTNTLVATVNVGLQPDGICIPPNGMYVYVGSRGNGFTGAVNIINTVSNTVVANISVPTPGALTASPDGSRVFVTGNGGGTLVKVINTATNTIIHSIPVGAYQFGISASPDGNYVFVCMHTSNVVKIVNTHSNTVVATLPVGTTPYSFGNFIASIGGTKFITSCNSYYWNGSSYTSSGNYTYTTANTYGCDSFSKLTLTILSDTTGSSSLAVCDSLVWNGIMYTNSGVYTNTFTNAAGCDSIHTLSLTIHTATVNAGSNQQVCEGNEVTLTATGDGSYVWNNSVINGQTFIPVSSQTYTVIATNSQGCTASSQVTITLNALPQPTILASGATTLCEGNSVYLHANTENGLTYKWFRDGIEISNTTTSSLLVSQTGNYAVEETNSANCLALSSLIPVTVHSCNVNLHLKLFFQGYYDGASTMRPALYNEGVTNNPTEVDSIVIALHSRYPPYGFVLSEKTILHTDGTTETLFNYQNGNYYLTDSYYVSVLHRNGLATWSANPIAFTSPVAYYNFSTSSSNAYGDNMIEVDPGVWALYSGDLNYDVNVDLLDSPILEDDISNFHFGYYASDLNGDGNSDLLDNPTLEGNILNFIFSLQPAWTGLLPVVSTAAVSTIIGNSAICGGEVLSDGNLPVVARGICWSSTPQPMVTDNKTNDGTGTGSFVSTISGLLPNTTYYIRAYATNSVGTVYGNEVDFITGN